MALTAVTALQSATRCLRICCSSQKALRCPSLQAGHYIDDGPGLGGTGSSPGSAEKGKAPMEVQQRAETLKHKCIKASTFSFHKGLN